ncbi:MAG: hypothetical protein KC777_10340 [Cyanobacteria bacterium HKST-UBA02]|nr:hypothetical protein [Cyanobacteria bacterium HKST-UBA02]
MNRLRRPGSIIVLLVLTACLLSFFGNPGGNLVREVIVDPAVELEATDLQEAFDAGFAERVLNSSWAMVLIHSNFSDGNAVGLEALRNWAKEQLSRDKQFLHPLSIPRRAPSATVFDALSTRLLGNLKTALDTKLSQFLAWRVGEFARTGAYQSFRVDYYELFGVSNESGTLLARYQDERARSSLGALTGALFWLLFGTVLTISYLRAREKQISPPAQRYLSYIWLAFSFFYLVLAWSGGNVGALAACLIAFVAGAYLRYPVRPVQGREGEVTLSSLALTQRTCVVLAWLTFSLVGIQIVSWLRFSFLNEPDPLTLIICAMSGDFIHDPVNVKRTIVEILGVSWAIVTVWAAVTFKRGALPSSELETQLESLAMIEVEADLRSSVEAK